MAEGDADRLTKAYDAFNEGGVRAILEFLDPEIHVRDRPTMPDAATYHGRAGVKKMFDSIVEAFDDLQYEVEEIIDRGRFVVVVLKQHVRGRSSQIRVGAQSVHVWEMRDGHPITLTIFGSKEHALATLERAELRAI
jgi:ketosteroid isomerase-like protein